MGHKMYDDPTPSYATRGGAKKKKKKRGKLIGFKVALCVILLKENVPLKKVMTKDGSSRTRNSVGEDSQLKSSSGKKRKRSQPFVFPARKLCVMLHAPLQTSVKKSRGMAETTRCTGVQKGKTVVEFVYDMNAWIDKPNQPDIDDLSLTSGVTKVR